VDGVIATPPTEDDILRGTIKSPSWGPIGSRGYGTFRGEKENKRIREERLSSVEESYSGKDFTQQGKGKMDAEKDGKGNET